MIRSEKTRQLIIKKTASIFNKKGYTGTYLSDLTNATGLTKGSIYGNFKDKNEVALEAFRYNYKFQT
ncbi:TetR/AcrR family transcriptional regulator, partial [Aquimarina sp. AD10]